MVTVTDPDGFPINLIWGQKPATAEQAPEILPVNYGVEKARVREFQRFNAGPAAVHKVRSLKKKKSICCLI